MLRELPANCVGCSFPSHSLGHGLRILIPRHQLRFSTQVPSDHDVAGLPSDVSGLENASVGEHIF